MDGICAKAQPGKSFSPQYLNSLFVCFVLHGLSCISPVHRVCSRESKVRGAEKSDCTTPGASNRGVIQVGTNRLTITCKVAFDFDACTRQPCNHVIHQQTACVSMMCRHG